MGPCIARHSFQVRFVARFSTPAYHRGPHGSSQEKSSPHTSCRTDRPPGPARQSQKQNPDSVLLPGKSAFRYALAQRRGSTSASAWKSFKSTQTP
jgi:hypothetical protein